MRIQAFPSGPFETNAYVVSNPAVGQAILIDPAPGCSRSVCEYLSDNDLTPVLIVITHSHWDHIADTAFLKKKYSIPVWIHPADAPNLQAPGSDRLPCWLSIEGVIPDKLIEEGDLVKLGEEEFMVIHTPGHSPGGICLYCQGQKILISGDTLFKGSIGNISFPTSQPERMWDSLDKLAKLPPETKVFPGHGSPTFIKDEDWLPNAKKIFG